MKWRAGAPINTTFIDSQENLFNHREPLVPLNLRDVVWILDSERGSDEVEFDDYVNPDSLIVSDMTAAMSLNVDAPPAPHPRKPLVAA